MTIVESATTERINIMLDLVASLSRATDPKEVLHEFSAGMEKLRGPSGFISLSCRGLEPGHYRVTRLLNHDNLTDISRADPWSMANRLRVHEGGFLGEVVRNGTPRIINDLNVRNDPVLGEAIAHYRSCIATPLFDNGEPLNWSLQLRREPGVFTPDDLEDALLRSNLVGNTVRHVQTVKLLRQADARMQAEMQRIAGIQRALLPELPRIPGLRLAASYETFDQAGGDFYAFQRLSDCPDEPARWAILIGDVSGHGPAAAVVMAMTSTLLSTVPPEHCQTPATVLRYLNRHLSARKIEQSFVTAFLGLFDPETRELSYSNAGHPLPLWRRLEHGDMRVRPLEDARGLPLGVLPDAAYEDSSVQLETGDTLALYTDGVTESRDRDGDFFGTGGVERALRQCSGEPDCLVGTLCRVLREHEAGARPGDDQTLLAMQLVHEPA